LDKKERDDFNEQVEHESADLIHRNATVMKKEKFAAAAAQVLAGLLKLAKALRTETTAGKRRPALFVTGRIFCSRAHFDLPVPLIVLSQ
jgi:hypothetical protein